MGDGKTEPGDHKADLEQVAQQVGAVDATTAVSRILNGTFFGGVRFFGKTDFENHELNHMIDLVETANPDDLESAGKALWDARDSIKDAAEELSGHIDRVDWEGESGTAFRTWGNKLVTHTHGLAEFADAAGTQITAAGTGLASVRSAMPPRDTRDNPKAPDKIPTPARVDTNHEYVQAVKVEKDRQEAINQMNRLSSFYAVSEEALAAQEPPTFEPMPSVGVPKPEQPTYTPERPGGTHENGNLATVHKSSTDGQQHVTGVISDSRPVEVTPPLKDVDDVIGDPPRDVGTDIDSVDTLPQETTRPVTGTPPSVSGQHSATSGTVPPFTGTPVPPTFGGPVGRAPGPAGATGVRAPISAQGRPSPQGSTSGGRSGRGPMGPMGRAAATGQAGGRGTGAATGRSPMGRGVSGGTPRPAGGTAAGRAGGAGSTGAGRGNGVVGGKPAKSPASGATGSRVPRGTVVGAEGTASSRTPGGKIAQRGVIGAPNSTTGNRNGTARPSAGNPDGVVGTPNGRASAGKRGGGVSGDEAAGRGPAGSPRGAKRDDRQGARHSRRSAEGETPQPESERRNEPPVTD
ncbi:hypothetical protein [Streptomyces sp. NPDC058371]|uniref:hypothetical protein n=1 Tax=Streptomyces sp. NPDC058371 TaxID=3346463 RepID=UPI003659A700